MSDFSHGKQRGSLKFNTPGRACGDQLHRLQVVYFENSVVASWSESTVQNSATVRVGGRAVSRETQRQGLPAVFHLSDARPARIVPQSDVSWSICREYTWVHTEFRIVYRITRYRRPRGGEPSRHFSCSSCESPPNRTEWTWCWWPACDSTACPCSRVCWAVEEDRRYTPTQSVQVSEYHMNVQESLNLAWRFE